MMFLHQEGLLMSKSLKRIVITGGAGQVAYSLLFRIAAGEMLGQDQPVALHLLEVPGAREALEGVFFELDDCCATFPLLQEVKIGSDPEVLFKDADYFILIGAKPRGHGMERSDLLQENAQIFIEQGRALNAVAKKDAIVLVVGNPCHTNCLIVQHFAPWLGPGRFFSMTQLDQNRFAVKLAKKANVPLDAVSHVTIWGNHSATQVPDYVNAQIYGKSALDVIGDETWCKEVLVPSVQKRGAEIIKARGKSSAASAANAILQCMRHLIFPTKEGETFSCGVLSDGNPYGIAPGIVFSFPCKSLGDGNVEIVPGLKWTPDIRKMIEVSEKELLDERSMVEELLKE